MVFSLINSPIRIRGRGGQSVKCLDSGIFFSAFGQKRDNRAFYFLFFLSPYFALPRVTSEASFSLPSALRNRGLFPGLCARISRVPVSRQTTRMSLRTNRRSDVELVFARLSTQRVHKSIAIVANIQRRELLARAIKNRETLAENILCTPI